MSENLRNYVRAVYGLDHVLRLVGDPAQHSSVTAGGPFRHLVETHPERTPEFFFRLASLVPGPAFVRFMSDQAGWADNARIIAALPPGPFLGALQGRARLARLPA